MTHFGLPNSEEELVTTTNRDALQGYPEHIRQRVLEEFLTRVHPETEIIRVSIDRYDCYPEDDCPNLRELTVGSHLFRQFHCQDINNPAVWERHRGSISAPITFNDSWWNVVQRFTGN